MGLGRAHVCWRPNQVDYTCRRSKHLEPALVAGAGSEQAAVPQRHHQRKDPREACGGMAGSTGSSPHVVFKGLRSPLPFLKAPEGCLVARLYQLGAPGVVELFMGGGQAVHGGW